MTIRQFLTPWLRPAMLRTAVDTAVRAVLPVTAIVMTAVAAVAQGGAPYRNLVNKPFATVSSGPQSALIVDIDSPAAQARAATAGVGGASASGPVVAALTTLWRAQAHGAQHQLAMLARRAATRRQRLHPFPVTTVVFERRNGKLVLPGGGDRATLPPAGAGLQVSRASFVGFGTQDSSDDTGALNTWWSTIYQPAEQVYGAPAWNGPVKIVAVQQSDPLFTDVYALEFGAYDVSTQTIYLPYYNDLDSMRLALLVDMLHAFHGPAVLSYDAWEQGFARAAASVVLRNPNVQTYLSSPSVNSAYAGDPTADNFLSLLSFYDLLNQPPLGNSTFFPSSEYYTPLDASSTLSGGAMFLPRLSMSSAAWLKVFIESQGTFFASFNAAYYTAFNADNTVAGNVPELTNLAAGVVGSVETLPFAQWYAQQYVLDTSVTTGDKLYAFVIPGNVGSSDDGGDDTEASSIDLVNFVTTNMMTPGNETLLSGTASATFLDDTNAQDFFTTVPNSVTITNGEGFLTVEESVSTYDIRRLTGEFVAADAEATTYIPEGYIASPAPNYLGVLLGPNSDSGSVTVKYAPILGGGQPGTVTTSIQRASFGAMVNNETPLDLAKTYVTVTPTGGVATTYQKNTGDGAYYAVLTVGDPSGGYTTLTQTFNPITPQNLPQLVSLPIQPLGATPDVALGLPTSEFLLNTWNTIGNAFQTFDPTNPVFSLLTPGRGFFLTVSPSTGINGANSGVTVTTTGIAVPTDVDYSIAAPYGWNLVGSPFPANLPLDSVQVNIGGQLYTWGDTTDYQTISQTTSSFYGWDPTSSTDPNPVVADTTDSSGNITNPGIIAGAAWQAYWIRVYLPAGVTIVMPAPNSSASPAATAAARRAAASRAASRTTPAVPLATPHPQWQVNLTAHQQTTGPAFTANAGATLGVASGVRATGFDPRIDRELPPMIIPAVQVAFDQPDWDGGRSLGGRYVADFRSPGNSLSSTTWNLHVSTPSAGPASLAWNNTATIPRLTRLVLVDVASGQRTPLASQSSYTWTATAGATRFFQIVAGPDMTVPLSIRNLTVVRAPAGSRAAGASGGYTLSCTIVGDSDPTIQATISSFSGRLLKHLDAATPAADDTASSSSTSRSVSPALGGQYVIHWDGTGDNGAPLPIGSYMITITLVGSNGGVDREIRPILLVR
jgi:hypothetical protein